MPASCAIAALLLVPAAAQAGPASKSDAAHAVYARALVCASTDAVLAGMLEGGEPTQADLADAAMFRARAKAWLARAVAASPAGQDAALAEFDREALRLGQSGAAARDAGAAQGLLDARLLGCDDSAATQAESAADPVIIGASPA